MDALQITVLVLVAVGATAVVLIRAHVRQVLALSFYGVLLAVLFLVSRRPTSPSRSWRWARWPCPSCCC